MEELFLESQDKQYGGETVLISGDGEMKGRKKFKTKLAPRFLFRIYFKNYTSIHFSLLNSLKVEAIRTIHNIREVFKPLCDRKQRAIVSCCSALILGILNFVATLVVLNALVIAYSGADFRGTWTVTPPSIAFCIRELFIVTGKYWTLIQKKNGLFSSHLGKLDVQRECFSLCCHHNIRSMCKRKRPCQTTMD